MYSIMSVECEKGLQISLDSDFTADYKEYVLGLEATKFSMNSSSLTSSSDQLKNNKFQADMDFAEDQKAMIDVLRGPFRDEEDFNKPLPILYNMMTFDQAIDLQFKIVYFNKKTFC